jgi:hypothetical protein
MLLIRDRLDLFAVVEGNGRTTSPGHSAGMLV